MRISCGRNLIAEVSMRIADVMQTELKTIRGTDTVGEAIALLAESHVTGVPVVDDHGRLAGVLSNSDILELLAERNDPESREAVFEETLVQEVMTPRPQTITPDAELKDAAQRMLYLEVHRLFVELEGRLVGVVSTTDLVRALAGARVEVH
ncbi:MAG TPA: CBS domain-containing protein [Gemmatimonadales bacterium]|nr:CBS domain-containing protein [Gemmatimonadales bacterium]